MNHHHQLRRFSSSSFSVPGISMVRFGQREVKYLSVCQIDRFFEQPQNRTPEGWIDTSPISASTPSAQAHVMPVNAEKHSSQIPVEDLFDTTVSKHCQTLGEVSNLAKSLHRPLEDEFVEPVPVPEPTVASVSE